MGQDKRRDKDADSSTMQVAHWHRYPKTKTSKNPEKKFGNQKIKSKKNRFRNRGHLRVVLYNPNATYI